MGDQQIIAGVLLGERLAVTMYGGIHRAQHAGQRNLRGLVIDAKMLAEEGFRRALTDQKGIESTLALSHPHIVPQVAVESEGPEVVVVTQGTGRYVTAQDLISAARSSKQKKLAPDIIAAIAKAVVEALATAHAAGVVHGAVHPRSVLIDEQGDVRLGDFVVGRALTTAVAQGADSSLWRGLAGYIAPELVVGEDPTPKVDVFGVGALLFTMITGEVPPGSLHSTPAMERLVTRALDTDTARRYASAKQLLENFLEAIEDDNWRVASKADLVTAAGLQANAGLDDATEDLLASLGTSAVQVMPTRPSMDIRAEAVAARHQKSPQQTTGGRLDALLADLDEVEEAPRKPDPIAALISSGVASTFGLAGGPRARVPSLDDPDEEDEPPPPTPRSEANTLAPPLRTHQRSASMDESAALDALAGLDEPARRMSTAAEQASVAADRLEAAAKRAEAAAVKLDSGPALIIPTEPARAATDTVVDKPPTVAAKPRAKAPNIAQPIVDPIRDLEAPTPKLKSPVGRIIGGILVLGVIVGGGYLVMTNFANQDERAAEDKARQDKLIADKQKAADEARKSYEQNQIDPGAIVVDANVQAGVWLRIGRTPCNTMPLAANTSHELALLGDDTHAVGNVQVLSQNWAADPAKGATITATLPVAVVDPKTKKTPPVELPMQPPSIHTAQTGPTAGNKGPIHIESSPADAEVWLFVGVTGSMRFDQLTAGRDYELVVAKTGYKQKHVSITADEWRDNDPDKPIDLAKKKDTIRKTVELEKLEKTK